MKAKLYLCIDNCFASKRYTLPEEWAKLIKSMGLQFVEASADTECDPLYMDQDYLRRWIDDVKKAYKETGVKVAKLFSGHGTYATLGLTHTDKDARIRFKDKWIKAHIDTAAALNAGIGFFAHGIDESVLQDPDQYRIAIETLYESLADIALYGKNAGISDVGLEQMYSPHQPPWTIDGTEKLLRSVYEINETPVYVTLDLGHMNGQQYFKKPDLNKVKEIIIKSRTEGRQSKVWVGSQYSREIFDRSVNGEIDEKDAASLITENAEKYPHLFAEEKDCDVYNWIERFGCYSPIMHLQQSDGMSSPHWPFSAEKNKIGIIDGKKVLSAIARSYEQASLPIPKTENIYLTLEPFISTAGNVYDSIYEITESVKYWRNFIPHDGITLEEALKQL